MELGICGLSGDAAQHSGAALPIWLLRILTLSCRHGSVQAVGNTAH